MNDSIRDKINKNCTGSEIKQFLSSNGYFDMLSSGIEKIKAGITSTDEVLRVILADLQS